MNTAHLSPALSSLSLCDKCTEHHPHPIAQAATEETARFGRQTEIPEEFWPDYSHIPEDHFGEVGFDDPLHPARNLKVSVQSTVTSNWLKKNAKKLLDRDEKTLQIWDKVITHVDGPLALEIESPLKRKISRLLFEDSLPAKKAAQREVNRFGCLTGINKTVSLRYLTAPEDYFDGKDVIATVQSEMASSWFNNHARELAKKNEQVLLVWKKVIEYATSPLKLKLRSQMSPGYGELMTPELGKLLKENVDELSLYHFCTPKHLRHLTLPSLKSLSIYFPREAISAEQLKPLLTRSLRTLRLQGVPVGNAIGKHLPKKLKKLVLRDAGIDDEIGKHLKKLTKLEKLDITSNPTRRLTIHHQGLARSPRSWRRR